MKHTPTPWVVEGDDSENGIPFIQIARDVPCGPDAKYLAKVDCTLPDFGDWFLSDEDRANADFIVKAVNCHDDLVRALEMVLEISDPYCGGCDCTAEVKFAEATLAKAKAST